MGCVFPWSNYLGKNRRPSQFWPKSQNQSPSNVIQLYSVFIEFKSFIDGNCPHFDFPITCYEFGLKRWVKICWNLYFPSSVPLVSLNVIKALSFPLNNLKGSIFQVPYIWVMLLLLASLTFHPLWISFIDLPWHHRLARDNDRLHRLRDYSSVTLEFFAKFPHFWGRKSF